MYFNVSVQRIEKHSLKIILSIVVYTCKIKKKYSIVCNILPLFESIYHAIFLKSYVSLN